MKIIVIFLVIVALSLSVSAMAADSYRFYTTYTNGFYTPTEPQSNYPIYGLQAEAASPTSGTYGVDESPSLYPEASPYSITPIEDVRNEDGSIGTLSIPAINLSHTVCDGDTYAAMAKGVGHIASTSCFDSNIGLVGHNRGVNTNFGRLSELKIGDMVTFTTKLGTRQYAVTFAGVIAENDWSYGYNLVNGNLVVNEDEAAVVRRIYEEYLSGRSAIDIAADLKRDEISKQYGSWTCRSIYYILQNEKYSGNALVQKRYTTDTFPFQKRKNKNDVEMYYLRNSHESIIDEGVFTQASQLMRARTITGNTTHKPYVLTSLITCNCCNAHFIRRVCRGITYWSCSQHEKGNLCPNKQIPETHLQASFVRTWNKLHSHRHEILTPMLSQLERLRLNSTCQNSRVCDIDSRIAELNKQNHALNLLRSKGNIDSVLFMEKTNALNQSAAELRKERSRLLNGDDDETINATKLIIAALEDGGTMTAFNENCFTEIIDRIIAVSQTEVRFVLKNGLELTEYVERIGR